MSIPTLALAAAGLACATGLAGTAAASAQTHHRAASGSVRTVSGHEFTRDARRDVVEIPENDDRAGHTTPRPGVAGGDLTSLASSYDADRLRMTLGLRAEPTSNSELFWDVKTPTDEYEAVLLRYRGKTYFLFLPEHGAHRACRGLTRSHGAHEQRLRIPASCLGSPAWVRTGAGSVTHVRDFSSSTVYADDVRLDGRVPGGNKDLSLGPRIHR